MTPFKFINNESVSFYFNNTYNSSRGVLSTDLIEMLLDNIIYVPPSIVDQNNQILGII